MRNLGRSGTALADVASGLQASGGSSGNNSCLTSVADCLAGVLGVRSAFVAETLDAGSAHIHASSGPDQRRIPSDGVLAGSVCAEVLERGSARYGTGVARRFPDDAFLGGLGVEAFSGRALRDAAASPIGLLAAIDAVPLSWTPESDALLSILALVAELELRRIRSERKLSRVARQWTATVDTIPDFVAVIAPDFRLLRVNLALSRFANCSPRELVGRTCHQVLHGLDHPWRDCPHEQAMRTGRSAEREVNDPYIGLPLCVTCTPFHDDNGKLVGTVHVARDISEQRRAVRVREKLIGELQETLAKVKVLSGLLPICAVCKKIRDDSGYWEQVEVYVRDRTDATFSHGICPACARELYPDFAG